MRTLGCEKPSTTGCAATGRARPVRPAVGNWLAILGVALAAACGGAGDEGTEAGNGGAGSSPKDWSCVADPDGDAPEYLNDVGCESDFAFLASEPLDASIPGARSVKVVLDRVDDETLYFQNSALFPIHWEFATAHLSSGAGLPPVPDLTAFNTTEYYSASRRFILGTVTYYEGPAIWALELASYDTASLEMIGTLYEAIAGAAWFGPQLAFHPSSVTQETVAEGLPDHVRVVTTDDIFAGIDYQPLNLGRAKGYLRLMTAADLATEYVGARDVLVLDRVPNDISVVMGLITEDFQTPLSHVNVLSQNRGTPNMGLRGAMTDETLRALEGKWVVLDVGAFDWTIEEISVEEADEWWASVQPEAVGVPRYDTSVTELRDIEEVVSLPEDGGSLKEAISDAIPAFGGKASHFSVLARTPNLIVPKAFGIPVYYYDQFMRENGFDVRIAELLADETFMGDPAVRDAELAELRADMMVAAVNEEFQALLRTKLETDYPGVTAMRFRSSTNAEDLDGFTGAGLYTSRTGDPTNWDTVLDALREVWGSVWFFRAFEEREYRSIDHNHVGMSLLVHHSFVGEPANGVALTANPFDESGLEPGVYVNVQVGENSVVQPSVGVTTDQFIYYYSYSTMPLVYLTKSNLVFEDEATVLTPAQVFQLGQGLQAIHAMFSPAYGPGSGNSGYYAMDVEFKLWAETSEELQIVFKQARPHPGRGDEDD
ncbi:MAG: hypothetical protein JW751_26085 [Polyangiaceae bacterium]|nr:hypothetical protein [Polyangiaceae bacterium]